MNKMIDFHGGLPLGIYFKAKGKSYPGKGLLIFLKRNNSKEPEDLLPGRQDIVGVTARNNYRGPTNIQREGGKRSGVGVLQRWIKYKVAFCE